MAVVMPEPPLRLLVLTLREPERGFGQRKLQKRGGGNRKEPADLLWMMSPKRCAKKDGDEQIRMDAGMAGG